MDNIKRKKNSIIIGTDKGSRLLMRRLPKNKFLKHTNGKNKDVFNLIVFVFFYKYPYRYSYNKK